MNGKKDQKSFLKKLASMAQTLGLVKKEKFVDPIKRRLHKKKMASDQKQARSRIARKKRAAMIKKSKLANWS